MDAIVGVMVVALGAVTSFFWKKWHDEKDQNKTLKAKEVLRGALQEIDKEVGNKTDAEVDADIRAHVHKHRGSGD